MKKFYLPIILAIFIFYPSYSFSQIVLPKVSSPVVEKIAILVPDLQDVGASSPLALEFSKVLRNDLMNAALFDVKTGFISDPSGENIDYQILLEQGVDFAVAGQYKAVGSNLTIALRIFDVNQKRPITGRTYEASPGKVREAAHRFANIIMKELTGIDGFFTSKIAVVVGNKKRNLFLMDYDGENMRQLTGHNSLLLSPDCSHDGRRIVFNSDKVWDQDLYVLDIVPRSRERKISTTFTLEQSAEWSPDGSRLAYSANGDIYVSSSNGSGARRLTSGYAIDVSPTWSPDGKSIAFVSDRTGSPQIYVMNAGGGEIKRLTYGSYNTDPSWSPNPRVNKIAYVNVSGSQANIFTINPDSSENKQLTSGSRRNENPSWSPDGHFISFSSNRTATKDIYIMYLNGENQKKLSKGGGKSFPTWCKR